MKIVVLQGGPLDGLEHELMHPLGLGPPDSIGMPVDPDNEDSDRAWYCREGDRYVYVKTERRS